jgi:hypothetical protein
LLKGLAEGEDEEEEEDEAPPRGISVVWVAVLAGALAISLILNLGLLVALARSN